MKKFYTLISFIAIIFAVNFTFAQVNVISDPSFEAGTPSTAWVESSTNFGTPLCDANCGTCNGKCASRTGSWYAWFGGIAALENASVSQSAVIPTASSANLSFWFKIAIASGVDPNDSIFVKLDGNTLWVAKNADSTTYANYTEIVIPINSYANGASHSLLFSSVTHGGGVTNYLVDDVSIISQTATGVHSNYLFEGISVYPNPAIEKINIEIDAPISSDYEITLYNMSGQKVYYVFEADMQNGIIEIPTIDFAKGAYQLVLSNTLETKVQKIIIN